jgi:hypothetical protein
VTVTIESTDKFVELNGVPARIWEGQTHKGARVIVYVTRIAVRDGEDVSEFESDLRACREPSAAAKAIPLRMIL